MHHLHGSQKFLRLFRQIFLRYIEVYPAGFIMILNNSGNEADRIYQLLRKETAIAIHIRGNRSRVKPSNFGVCAGMCPEVKHGRKIAIFPDKLRNLLLRLIKDFSHGKRMMRLKAAVPHLPQKFTDSFRGINHISAACHAVFPICREIIAPERKDLF